MNNMTKQQLGAILPQNGGITRLFVWSNTNCDERHNINDENVYRN